jgi:uncharacterized protein (TIGR03067 family)
MVGNILALAALTLAAPEEKKEESAKTELARLSGTWTVVRMEADGKAAAQDSGRWTRAVFNGDKLRLTVNAGGQEEARGPITVAVDLTNSPRRIDLTDPGMPGDRRLVLGIYEIKDDKLTLCITHPPESKNRPTKFDSKGRCWLLVLRRVSK